MPGVIDDTKKKIDDLDKTYNPFRIVSEAIKKAPSPGSPKPDVEQALTPSRGSTVQVDDSVKTAPLKREPGELK